jgi:hypothetical protein
MGQTSKTEYEGVNGYPGMIFSLDGQIWKAKDDHDCPCFGCDFYMKPGLGKKANDDRSWRCLESPDCIEGVIYKEYKG